MDTDVVELSLAEIESRLQALLSERGASRDNPGSVGCERCERCIECTFCKGGRSLTRCHYCVDCERCHASQHCRSSIDLVSCNHCEDCERCTTSSYLVRCHDCSQCTYCFACVGLVGKEFCILNQPVERSVYFATMKRLQARGRAAR